ncbi:6728_t:CDS:2, partial [Paraglomus brasilianum]
DTISICPSDSSEVSPVRTGPNDCFAYVGWGLLLIAGDLYVVRNAADAGWAWHYASRDKKLLANDAYVSRGWYINEALAENILNGIDENAFKYPKPKTMKSNPPKNNSKLDNSKQDVMYAHH